MSRRNRYRRGRNSRFVNRNMNTNKNSSRKSCGGTDIRSGGTNRKRSGARIDAGFGGMWSKE